MVLRFSFDLSGIVPNAPTTMGITFLSLHPTSFRFLQRDLDIFLLSRPLLLSSSLYYYYYYYYKFIEKFSYCFCYFLVQFQFIAVFPKPSMCVLLLVLGHHCQNSLGCLCQWFPFNIPNQATKQVLWEKGKCIQYDLKYF